MEGVEADGQARSAGSPLGSLPNRSVGDLAQRAMAASEAGTDPVGELAPDGAVGVVDADQAHDLLGRCRVG